MDGRRLARVHQPARPARVAPDVREPSFCEACFSGDYPVEIPPSTAKKSFMTKADFAAEYARESEKAEKTQVTL